MKRSMKAMKNLFVAGFVLSLILLSGASEAGVMLIPRVNSTGQILKDDSGVPITHEDYVLFGRYPQCLGFSSGSTNDYETSSTPILWRVMSSDLTGTPKKALLMTHYLIEVNRYNVDTTSNAWAGSTMRSWLNGTADSVNVYQWNHETTLPGFLHTDRFTPSEKGAMLSPSPDGESNSYVTLPSSDDLNGRWFSNNASRIAYYKTKGPSGNGSWYWTRSPYSGDSITAWLVLSDGSLYEDLVNFAGAVRPAFFLNLESVIFKSDSASSGLSDSVLGFTPSAGVAGENLNPFLLYYTTEYLKPSTPPIVNGNSLIEISFDKYAAHAWATTSSDVKLGAKFTVTKNGTPINIGSADVQSGKVLLSPDVTLGTTDTVTVTYKAYRTSDTDGIGFPETNTVLMGFVQPTPPSGNVSVTGVTMSKPTLDLTTGESSQLAATVQPSNATNPKVTWSSSNPDVVSVDQTGKVTAVGPGTATITATTDDGKKTATCTITVTEAPVPGPTEKALFTINVADCEIIVTQNADGTLAVKVRIPFAASSNPALLDTVRMIASSLGLTNISYVWIDTQGKETPVARMAATAPYLEIRGTAANMDAIKNGVITKIEYTLKGDNGLYAQTFPNGGLKVASMSGYPSPTPAPSGSSSSGCDAGAMGLATLALAGCVVIGRRRK